MNARVLRSALLSCALLTALFASQVTAVPRYNMKVTAHSSLGLDYEGIDVRCASATYALSNEALGTFGCPDIVCCTTVVRDGALGSFSETDFLDIGSDIEAGNLFAEYPNYRCYVVNTITLAGIGEPDGLWGAAGQDKILYTSAAEGDVWAHELGHHVGLPDLTSGCENRIMRTYVQNGTRYAVDETECNAFATYPDANNGTGCGTPVGDSFAATGGPSRINLEWYEPDAGIPVFYLDRAYGSSLPYEPLLLVSSGDPTYTSDGHTYDMIDSTAVCTRDYLYRLRTVADTLYADAQPTSGLPVRPDQTSSYFVPQSGSVSTPTEGPAAIADARRCPNDDGTQVLRRSSRLKVVVRAADNGPVPGLGAADICVLFNGGTPTQGFRGVGDDSIIANYQYNQLANCPDVRCVQADDVPDDSGVTYITWIGATPGSPGVGTRDPLRKWGAYAGDIPVYANGFTILGKLTSASPLGSYTAHVKSLDVFGGRTTTPNQGELVNAVDINIVEAAIGEHRYQYNLDFDNDGSVDSIDLNFVKAHNNHKCNVPCADLGGPPYPCP